MFQGGWCPIIYGVINLAVTELSIDPSLWARPIRGTNWFLSSSTIKSLIGIICVETKKKLIVIFLGWITVHIISKKSRKSPTNIWQYFDANFAIISKKLTDCKLWVKLWQQSLELIAGVIFGKIEGPCFCLPTITIAVSLAQTVEWARAQVWVWVWCRLPLVSPAFEPVCRRLWEREPFAEFNRVMD